MAPFSSPVPVITGLKERVESLAVQGDKLYIGAATGSVLVYKVLDGASGSGSTQAAQLAETRKSVSKKSIDQLGVVPDISSLVVLSDSVVTLHGLPNFTPVTPLTQAKSARTFAVFTTVEYEGAESAKNKGVAVMITYLAVGCYRKLVLYSWKDGEHQDTVETTLPHSARIMSFIDGQTICLGYSPTDYVLYSLKTRTTLDVVAPSVGPAASTSVGGMSKGALSGLGGYIGLGAKSKPSCFRLDDNEVFIARENNGVFIGLDGKPSRTSGVDWPAPPEEIAYAKPYIFSILPAGSVPSSAVEGGTNLSAAASFIPTTVVEVRSSISLIPSQTLPVPFKSPISGTTYANHSARLLTSSPGSKSPLYLLTTSTDRAAATAEGSTLWSFTMIAWGEQVDELVRNGAYADALALLDSLSTATLPDKELRQRVVRGLLAVSQFRSARYADAMSLFLELNINPAKVVALYPESVSGRLSVPEDDWIRLFGGPAPEVKSEISTITDEPGDLKASEGDSEHTEPTQPTRPPSPQGSIRGLIRSGLDSVRPTARREDELETASIKIKRKEFGFRKSIEELMLYLSDRRPKVAGALETLNITSAEAHQMPLLSAASKEDLFALPDAPLTALTPEELVRFAQIVDTALFKCYLLARPGLLAPLCRVANWCEVAEVEEVLRAREKFSELIYLYNGKKMHGNALDLLQQLSEKEFDMRDKLVPSVNYLQRLGPEYLELIFEHSRWVFEKDRDIAFDIFTSEEVELPRPAVADFLEKIDPVLCIRYVEYLIDSKAEETTSFHNRLAELYLSMTMDARKRGDNETRLAMKEKLLNFIDTTSLYEIERLFAQLPPDDLFEAKAILLGRSGRHDNALEIYVYRLQDFIKAEEYCKRVYNPDGETKHVFLTLLRIYLRPTTKTSIDLLTPALELISRHSPRLDEIETLQILPPLVTAKDVQAFLVEALRAPIFHTRVTREISKTRDEQAARRLMYLQAKRVKVTDSRICPQCHKRLGHSVIAVHAPRGEVTHYQCREAFSKKLKELRG
ncbi:hypothetical protein BC835DRAFT_1363553 [Cytidiella melzeri]|nr:hypothetical protein BC835DRAFT_1363553 [Cytidiella melzeri]